MAFHASQCGLTRVATRSLAGGGPRPGRSGRRGGGDPASAPARGRRRSLRGRLGSAAATFAPGRLPSLPSHSSLSPGRPPVPSRCQAPSCQGGQCPINSSARRCVRPLPPQAGAEVPGPAGVGERAPGTAAPPRAEAERGRPSWARAGRGAGSLLSAGPGSGRAHEGCEGGVRGRGRGAGAEKGGASSSGPGGSAGVGGASARPAPRP